MKRFLLTVLVFNILQLNADDKCKMKAKEYLMQKRYSKALKLTEKCLKENRSAIECYFIRAAAELEMSELSKYKTGDINYFKKAVKSLKKGIEKDESETLKKEYVTYVQRIVKKTNQEALRSYAQKRYSKAILLYRDNFAMTGDTIARAMQGMSYYEQGKVYDGVEILKPVSYWMYDAYFDSMHQKTYMWEPFATLGAYYIKEGLFDSAQFYTEMGLELFPLHPLLRKNAKQLLVFDLKKSARRGVTVDFIEIINKGLYFFPSDSFFLVNQNSYFLDKMARYSSNGEDGLVDTAFTAFYQAKQHDILQNAKNGVDEFLIKDSLAFVFKCLDYGLRTNTRKLAAYFFKKWFTHINNFKEYTEFHSERLLSKPDENVSRRLTAIMFEDGITSFPKNNAIKNAQLSFFRSWLKESSSRTILDDKLFMCSSLVSDFGRTKELKDAKIKLLKQVYDFEMKAGDMEEVWQTFRGLQMETGLPLDALKGAIAKRDFEERFVGSAIAYEQINGRKVAQTGWTGSARYCDPGRMPDSTLKKVISRLNYFRQNAGILEPLYLSQRRLARSQAAAVMYSGKGVFTRDPEPSTHPCFTPEGKEAAKIVQGVLDNNPAQAITNLMNDRRSLELANRQSLLNIGNEYCGFGAAEDNSVFWLLDTSNTRSNDYHRTHFVCWPPEGLAPRMLLFGKWSFGLNANLSGASVSVSKAGNAVKVSKVRVEALPGLTLQTLIFEPSISLANSKAGDQFDVQVKLKDGSVYKYKIALFDYKK